MVAEGRRQGSTIATATLAWTSRQESGCRCSQEEPFVEKPGRADTARCWGAIAGRPQERTVDADEGAGRVPCTRIAQVSSVHVFAAGVPPV